MAEHEKDFYLIITVGGSGLVVGLEALGARNWIFGGGLTFASLVVMAPLSPFITTHLHWAFGRPALWAIALSTWLFLAFQFGQLFWGQPSSAPVVAAHDAAPKAVASAPVPAEQMQAEIDRQVAALTKPLRDQVTDLKMQVGAFKALRPPCMNVFGSQFRTMSPDCKQKLGQDFAFLKYAKDPFGVGVVPNEGSGGDSMALSADLIDAFGRAGIPLHRYWEVPSGSDQKGLFLAVQDVRNPPALTIALRVIFMLETGDAPNYAPFPDQIKWLPNYTIPQPTGDPEFILYVAPNPNR